MIKTGNALAIMAATAVVASCLTGSFILRSHAWDYTAGYQLGLEQGHKEANENSNRDAQAGGICVIYNKSCQVKLVAAGGK